MSLRDTNEARCKHSTASAIPSASTSALHIAFGERYKKMDVRPLMGAVGDAYDNAMAESFFASLECELIERRSWQTKTRAECNIT